MSWFTKVLGIDAKRNAADTAKRQAEATAKAEADAKAQQASTDAAQREYQTAMQNMQIENANLSAANKADLSTDTISNVVAGGTADAMATDNKKKRQAVSGGIAASLGINL